MAEQSFPFDAGPGAAVNEAQWQRMARRFLGTGVISGALSQLAVSAGGTSLSVSGATGEAFVEGFFYRNDAALALTIAAANATNPRVDTVVVRLDRTANAATLAVVTGTPSASPVAPTLSATDMLWELPLADVAVPATAGVILAGNVTDRREYAGSDRFDPGSVTAAPSAYRAGYTFGLVTTVAGWPVTGTLTTHKRSAGRIWQEVVKADLALAVVDRYFRQGYHGSTGPDGWGPWQRVRSGEDHEATSLVTAETTTSTAYVSLATVGPDARVTVGPSGRARIVMTGELENSTAGQTGYLSAMVVSGPTAVPPVDQRALVFTSSTAGGRLQASRETTFDGLTPGTYTFRLQYRVTGGTGTFRNRQIAAEAL